jgi:hypothetical protein
LAIFINAAARLFSAVGKHQGVVGGERLELADSAHERQSGDARQLVRRAAAELRR